MEHGNTNIVKKFAMGAVNLLFRLNSIEMFPVHSNPRAAQKARLSLNWVEGKTSR